MSPARTIPTSRTEQTWEHNGLQILAVGVEYPAFTRTQSEATRDYAAELYPSTPAMEKMIEIASKTGIESRNFAIPRGHPVMYAKESPLIDKQREMFLSLGVDQATAAARKALAEWGGDIRHITHVVGVSSMAFSNPGFEFYVAQNLGLNKDVERVVLHGVGCSGGLAGLRNAANIACGMSFLGRPARILVVSTELSSASTRNELDMIHNSQEVRIPAALFGDAATAIVLSNGIGEDPASCKPVYDVYAWQLTTLDDCPHDIALDVYPDGWRVNLTGRVPKLTANAIPGVFHDLVSRVPSLTASLGSSPSPADIDWAVHPGGAKILIDVVKKMNLTDDHVRASWDIYKNHGNTASATIFSVLNRLRKPDMGEGREWVVGIAFGPGISVETCVLRRCRPDAELEGLTADLKV